MNPFFNRYSVSLLCALSMGHSQAASGEFSTLTYNVAGLPEIISSAESNRQEATEQISCYVNAFDIVNVQEDFNYHATLYDTCNDHPYRSPTSGGAAIGSGLNTMSRFSYEDWARVRWNDCSGVDCLTPKGFTLARTQLQDGVFVDIYNLHTQAQTEPNDLAARRANLLQLASYIELHSAGNAVIIMGDTNTRYTRSGDNIREFLDRGFSDAWLQLVHTDDIPASGADALVCSPAVTDANCEIVDKVLYRDNGYLQLQPYAYGVREDALTNDGLELSDHRPIESGWTYETNDLWRFSERIGGAYGLEFNDYALLPQHPVVRKIGLRAGRRLDQIQTSLASGYVMTHGGEGGTAYDLTFTDGEYLQSATFCVGQYSNHSRIFYASLTSNQNRTLSAGSHTDDCTTFTAPEGWNIVGFHGRSGDEIDKLGVIYAPLKSSSVQAGFQPLVNAASGQCLDVTNGNMAEGNNVGLWYCSGEAWQQWNYDPHSGLIRNLQDAEYCLDNSGSFSDGANLIIAKCRGNANQRFNISSTGAIAMRTMPKLVIEANGSQATLKTLTSSNQQYWQ
ncbi:jacalin-like lectin [Gynuella sp.]|uniref:jacalin-like lectin n=1 Tax=Gynuella sp. TaxID=2969146 RepID=UPI003D0DCEFF